jgi:hypothetical protein
MRFAIVCWEFADAQRPRSLAEGLVAAGHEVVFYTSEPGAEESSYRVVSIPFSRGSTSMRSALGIKPGVNLAKAAQQRGRLAARAMSFGARVFEAFTQFPDKYRGWIPAVRSWLRANPGALEGTDVIIASTPPASALFVGRMLAQSCGARLVFDFRDLWTDNPSYPYRGLRKAIDRSSERRVMEAAGAATAATRSFADVIKRRYPEIPVRAMYTGVDPAPWRGFPARPVDHRLVFGHFGVWYPQRRTIRPLLESLRRLADACILDQKRVSVQLWGNGADMETWDAVSELGMGNVVSDCGWLAPSEVPAHLASVDVALLLAWPDDTISVPVKTHGYIASGKPVLVLGANPESEMMAILRGIEGVTLALTPAEIDEAVLGYWRCAERGEPDQWAAGERRMPVTQGSMVADLFVLLTTTNEHTA